MLNKFNSWITSNNLSNIGMCLSELNKIDFEKIVIGVNNIKQLKEIISFKKRLIKATPDFKINNINLIDPREW